MNTHWRRLSGDAGTANLASAAWPWPPRGGRAVTGRPGAAGFLAPLSQPPFRTVWVVWSVASLGVWMHDVASGWLMTSIGGSALWVGLLQTAATLPLFLFGLPAGALADRLDRHLFLLVTQLWTAAVAIFCWLAVGWGLMTPWLLIAFTAASGLALAARAPVIAALTCSAVSVRDLPGAIGLNSVGSNLARIVGPLAAGGLIAVRGPEVVYLIVAVLATLNAAMLMRRGSGAPAPRPSSSLARAMAESLRFAWRSAAMRQVLGTGACFCFFAFAPLALLPLVARTQLHGDSMTYALLLTPMGVGAVLAAWLGRRSGRGQPWRSNVLWASFAHGAATCLLAGSGSLALSAAAMLLAGASWLLALTGLQTANQHLLHDEMRARGAALSQMVMLGACAVAALTWSAWASAYDLATALALAGGAGMVFSTLALIRERSARSTT